MKKNLLLMMSAAMMLTFGISSCSSSDDEISERSNDEVSETASDPNSIIGVWELKTLNYPEGDREIPLDDRDLFTFSTNGKVKVAIKKGKSLYPDLPNEDGEYDYFYDKEKQKIQLCSETLKCIISDGEMHLEGHHFGPDDGLYTHEFIFIKK